MNMGEIVKMDNGKDNEIMSRVNIESEMFRDTY